LCGMSKIIYNRPSFCPFQLIGAKELRSLWNQVKWCGHIWFRLIQGGKCTVGNPPSVGGCHAGQNNVVLVLWSSQVWRKAGNTIRMKIYLLSPISN
jgi:hypothetical protein